MISKEVADLLNIDDSEFKKTKIRNQVEDIVKFIDEYSNFYYDFEKYFKTFLHTKSKEDLIFTKDEYKEIKQILLKKSIISEYQMLYYISGALRTFIDKGIKIGDNNIFVYEDVGFPEYKLIFNNLEKGFTLTRDQFLPFLKNSLKYLLRNSYPSSKIISIDEVIRLSGYKLTIEDIKISIEMGSNMWCTYRRWDNLKYVYIKDPEKYGIIPDEKLFEYCKSIPILPLEYKFKGVGKAEYDEFKLEMDFIIDIRTCDNNLTLTKFKKISKKYQKVPLSTNIIRAILLKPIKADIVKHLISLNVTFTDEQVDEILCNSENNKNTEFWKYYKTKKDNEVKELQSQVKELQSQVKKQKIKE